MRQFSYNSPIHSHFCWLDRDSMHTHREQRWLRAYLRLAPHSALYRSYKPRRTRISVILPPQLGHASNSSLNNIPQYSHLTLLTVSSLAIDAPSLVRGIIPRQNSMECFSFTRLLYFSEFPASKRVRSLILKSSPFQPIFHLALQSMQ